MNRRQVSLFVLGILAVLMLCIVPTVLFVLFAAVLLGLFLRGGGVFIARHLPVSDAVGVGLFLLALNLAFIGLAIAFAAGISDQIDELSRQLPEAFASLRQRIEGIGWLNAMLERLVPSDPGSTNAAPAAAATLSAVLSAIGGFVVLGFMALYGAINPALYRAGLVALFAPSLRARSQTVLDDIAQTLRGWILARIFSMTVVGLLTTLGLWLAGIPLAGALGLISALLGFIPNLGPVLAAIPALLIAAAQGGSSVGIVLAIYIGVQLVETYGLTPVVEQKQVSLPPAVVLFAQLLMGSLFGIFGLAIASPLAALVLVVMRQVYVGDYLNAERRLPAHP